MSFRRFVSKFRFKRRTGRSTKKDASGKFLRRRRRLRGPTERDRVTTGQKALLLILIIVFGAVFFGMSMREEPHPVEVVSPEDTETTFSPPR